MSTLRVTNVQDTAGANSLTTAQIYNGAAKAWVNFNGTGTVAILGSFNVSSITDNAVGDYTVNFTTALADANFSCVASSGNEASDYRIVVPNFNAAPTSSACRLRSAVPASVGPATDDLYVYVAIFR